MPPKRRLEASDYEVKKLVEMKNETIPHVLARMDFNDVHLLKVAFHRWEDGLVIEQGLCCKTKKT